jgi:hypothetical protein
MSNSEEWRVHLKSIISLADRVEKYGDPKEAEVLRKCAADLEWHHSASVFLLRQNVSGIQYKRNLHDDLANINAHL